MGGINAVLRSDLESHGWFNSPGAYIAVDGQYGTTQKGLLFSMLAEAGAGKINVVMSNSDGTESIYAQCPVTETDLTTKSVPISSIIIKNLSEKLKYDGGSLVIPLSYLCGGAQLRPKILLEEIEKYNMSGKIWIHPHAIVKEDYNLEETSVVYFSKNPSKHLTYHNIVHNVAKSSVIFIEGFGGFSLGRYSGFYPICLPKECTTAQVLADTRISVGNLKKVAASYDTFPTRSGDGSYYPDQEGFSWSWKQFSEGLIINQPNLLLIDNIEHLKKEERIVFLEKVKEIYIQNLNRPVETIVLGYGSKNSDLYIYDKGKIWFNTTTGIDCKEP